MTGCGFVAVFAVWICMVLDASAQKACKTQRLALRGGEDRLNALGRESLAVAVKTKAKRSERYSDVFAGVRAFTRPALRLSCSVPSMGRLQLPILAYRPSRYQVNDKSASAKPSAANPEMSGV